MAATHTWKESNTVSEVETTATNINFGNVDEVNIIPASHSVNAGAASFEKYIRCLFTGVWTEISNLKLWRSDANGYKTGETLKAAANAAYATPSATPNADSDIPLSEGTALAINSAEGAATIIYGVSGVSGYTKYIRLQARTTGASPAGAVFQKTILFQYDEI